MAKGGLDAISPFFIHLVYKRFLKNVEGAENHITQWSDDVETISTNGSKVTTTSEVEFVSHGSFFWGVVVVIELSTLLPEHLLENAPSSSNVNSSSIQNGGKTINKGTVLKLSVDYIKDLRDEVGRYKDRVQELERMIDMAKAGGQQQQQFIKDEFRYSSIPTKEELHRFTNGASNVPSTKNNPGDNGRHERMGSLQFQQQFGNLHIAGDDPASQP